MAHSQAAADQSDSYHRQPTLQFSRGEQNIDQGENNRSYAKGPGQPAQKLTRLRRQLWIVHVLVIQRNNAKQANHGDLSEITPIRKNGGKVSSVVDENDA